MHKNFIEAVLKEPGHPWRKVLVQNELDVFQGIVDGFIETVPGEALDLPRAFGRHAIILNEEGKLHGSRPNFNIYGGLDWVCGTALIVGVRRDEFWDCWQGDVYPDDIVEYLNSHTDAVQYPDELRCWVPEDDDIIDRNVISKMYEDRIFPPTELEDELEALASEWEENHEGQDYRDLGWTIPEFTRTARPRGRATRKDGTNNEQI